MIDGMFVIDAHQHVWDPRRARYDWLTAAHAPVDRPVGFDEVRASLHRAGVDATVLVQAADNDDDTELMRDTARAHPEVAAIVAFAPLHDVDATAARLDELAGDRRVVGVRNLIHDLPDPDWILRADVRAGLDELARRDLTFDYVAVLPRHLEHVPTLAERHPGLRIVIDHLAKPPIGLDDPEPWRTLIARAAEAPNVFAKVSGLYAAGPDLRAWSVDLVRPHLHRALELFGADRLMYGGDWPVSVLAGGYDRVWDGLAELFAELAPGERAKILGATAQAFYRIPPELLERATDPADQQRTEQ